MSRLNEVKWKYIFWHTYLRVCNGATINIGKNVRILNCRIIVNPKSQLFIGNNVIIQNSTISIKDGKCVIRNNCIIGNKNNNSLINIEKGTISIDHHTKINARRIWIRFGGSVQIGKYTNINSESEIRCDLSVIIGNYNQISYNVKIWDTNTHNILPATDRRKLAEMYYPYYGKEIKRPISKPVIIGDDCWIGENASILKGCCLGNEVIVGYNGMIIGKNIPSNSTVITDAKLKIIERE